MPGEVRDRPWKTFKNEEPEGNMRKVGMIEEFFRKKKICGSVQDGFWEININLPSQDFSVEEVRQEKFGVSECHRGHGFRKQWCCVPHVSGSLASCPA